MKYTFPKITKFADIEHAVDRDFFLVANRDGHTIVNYLFSSPETFPDADSEEAILRREFRGLIFDEEGTIIRRPYHKFFNVGERLETQLENIDISKPHIILEKLDGSMIVPYICNNKVLWGTKMGDTDVSKQVYPFLEKNKQYWEFAKEAIRNGYSPIFEWCSRQQRIVLDYPKDELVLTAIRKMSTGEYVDYEGLVYQANRHNLSVVKAIESSLDADFLEKIKAYENVEGFVIRFDDGHMTKIKCDWYCQLHRVKSEISFERGVVQLILDEKVDDLKPLMMAEDLAMMENYESAFWDNFNSKVNDLVHVFIKLEGEQVSRKDFALNIAPTLPQWQVTCIFKMYGNNGATADHFRPLVKQIILSQLGRNSKFDELRKTSLFENVPVWRGVVIDDE